MINLRLLSFSLIILTSFAFKISAAEFPDLSSEEKKILERGELSQGRYIAGGIVGTAVGFGVGAGIQGSYWPAGFLFTVGDAVGMSLSYGGWIAANIGDDAHDTTKTRVAQWGGFGLYMATRIAEAIYVWVEPRGRREDYERVREKVNERSKKKAKLDWTIMPAIVDTKTYGLMAGLRF